MATLIFVIAVIIAGIVCYKLDLNENIKNNKDLDLFI